MTLTVENKLFEKGKNYDVSLKINDLQRFIGLQGTLKLENTEGVEIVGLSSDNLKNFDETNFYLKNPQQVAFSWNDFADKTFAAGDAVLTLKIHANETIELSKILTLNSDIVAAEAINQSGEARPIQLKFTKPSAKLPVFTAEPNPFLTETTVKFDLDTEGSIQYAVFDESGKQLFARKEIFKRGANVLTLTAREIGWQAAGFYFLKIETADGVQVLKLQKL